MAKRVRQVAAAVAVLLLIGFVAIVWTQRLQFPYEGPEDAVAAGEKITIRDPDGPCGPLLVSIWRPSVLGQWNQTHSGNAIDDSFSPDPRRWWSPWESGAYFTPVPCSIGGTITVTVPANLQPGVIAVCDTGRHCARIEVAE